MNTRVKFESTIEISNEVINDDFHKGTLKVLHDGINYNGSDISLEAIEDAMETIKNTPILAFIKRDENGEAEGFGGHESEIKIKNKDGKVYLEEFFWEIPIGTVPETNNARIEEIDGKNYLICDCFIWKSYSNEAYDLLLENEQTDVSCELKCKSIEFDENDVMHIKKFQFLGTTVIGTSPAMEGAEIDMNVDFSTDTKIKFSKAVDGLNKYLKDELKIKGEEVELQVENTEVKNDTTEVIDNKEVFEHTEEVIENTQIEDVQKFGLSIDNLRNSIQSQLKNITNTETNRWGDSWECRAYYLETILMDDKVVILEDSSDWNKHYGVSYSMNGDDVVLDFESKVEYLQEWRVKSGNEEVVTFERENVVEEMLLEKFEEKDKEITRLNDELDKLQEFKSNYEKQVKEEELNSQVEEVISKFTFEEDEISELKTKVLNEDIDIATFEINLKAMYCDKLLAEKDNKVEFSNKEINKIHVNHVETVEEVDETVKSIRELKQKFSK